MRRIILRITGRKNARLYGLAFLLVTGFLLLAIARRTLIQPDTSSSSHSRVGIREFPDSPGAAVVRPAGLHNPAHAVHEADIPPPIRNTLALMGMSELPHFLPNYKNPCWNETLLTANPYPTAKWNTVTQFLQRTTIQLVKTFAQRLQNGTRWRIRCLPYFYVAGMEKGGTTDLTEKLLRHPDLQQSVTNVPHWWSRARARAGVVAGNFKFPPLNLSDYTDLFDLAAENIRLAERNNYHHMITGEGSATTIDENDRWASRPENIGTNMLEPKYINAHLIHAVTPMARIIVSLRNPTARLYSAFLFYNMTPNKTSEQFHEIAEGAIVVWERCVKENTLRYCIYTPPTTRTSRSYLVNVWTGIYYAYIKDWLEVFSREQMHFVYHEAYAKDRVPVLNEVFQFLGVGPLPENMANEIRSMTVTNSMRTYSFNVGPILDKSKIMLDKFYAKYNRMLAELLGDERFLWKDQ